MSELSMEKFPFASVFVEATASMPPCNCSKITSAPAIGLFVVPFVTLPETVALEAAIASAIIATTARAACRGERFRREHRADSYIVRRAQIMLS